MTGRQLAWLAIDHFQEAEKDRVLVDSTRVRTPKRNGQKLQEAKFLWNHVLSKVRHMQEDELLTIMLLQLDGLKNDHALYLDYYHWRAKDEDDPSQDHQSLTMSIRHWVANKTATK